MSLYLIQRLEDPFTVDPTKGFDGFFRLDYMGSAEFEWGAIPAALKSMRERKAPYAAESFDLLVGDTTFTIWIVAKGDAQAAALDLQQFFLNDERPSKERPGVMDKVRGSQWARERIVAWWALDEDFAFALDIETAERLALAFNTRKA